MMYDCVRLLFTWFCTILQIYTLLLAALLVQLMGRTVYTAPAVDQLMHGCLLVQTKKQKTAHSAVRLRPNEHWQTQMVFGLFFRWTFIGLFVCFCGSNNTIDQTQVSHSDCNDSNGHDDVLVDVFGGRCKWLFVVWCFYKSKRDQFIW